MRYRAYARAPFTRTRAVLAGGLVLGIGLTMTLAAWTDQEFASTTVQAGTFSLQSRTKSTDTFADHDATARVTLQLSDTAPFYPGITKTAWIQIKATGSVGGTVSVSAADVSAATDPASVTLAGALRVRITASKQAGDTVPTCAATPIGDSTLTAVPSAQATILGNGAETATFCIVLTLPDNADSGAQGGAVDPIWTFTGTTG